ncbi:MAG: glycosyltransferase family 2 protein [Flavobacteriaceae bacterium]|nr:glycosyltransferase family 2 protein [Flavobacteriaceae bacterium]
MNIYIVIPAHNEEDSIGLTLDSLVMQSLLPKKVVVVNDNSTDSTEQIIEAFATKYSWITLVNSNSSNEHLPGAKIINAFYKGFDTLDDNYDVICKYDADLIFPENYLETLVNHFNADKKLGMVAGLCYIRKNKEWILEDLTTKKHIRGALKAYRKECFLEIGKLKPAMGWDTIDELLAQYYGWTFKTDQSLKVKHLKPTGISYGKGSKHLQGEALYKLRYGFPLAMLSFLKLAYKKKSFTLFKNYVSGYLKASKENVDFLITEDQGKFIRELRWKNIFKKFF